MITEVDSRNIDQAAYVHAVSWQESHRSFCTPDFIALHTPERQKDYLLGKLKAGSRIFMLIEDRPAGIVSVSGSLIEDLYILPDRQNRGLGTELLRFAITKCSGTPRLWILENNAGAERLYRRLGFVKTGRANMIRDDLAEIEYSLGAVPAGGPGS